MLKKHNGSSWVSAPTWKKMSSGLTSGLVSYYKMDETSGTTCTDSVGSNNGTIVGCTINQTGKIDKCYDLDGSNDYVNISNRISYTNKLSLSVWVKADAWSGNTGIISKRNGSGTNDFQLSASNGDDIDVILWGTSTVVLSASNVLNTGVWQHIVSTYDGANQKLYIDGSFVTSVASTGNISDNDIDTRIGDDWYGNAFNGKIDEVGIWNRALSSEEVSELYNTNKARKLETFDYDYADVKKYEDNNWNIINPIQYDQDLSNGLISYYNLDGDADDQVGSNDGTISGATYTSSGKVGGCYDFDGVNDYISCPGFTPDSWTEFSISTWVNFDTTVSKILCIFEEDSSYGQKYLRYYNNEIRASVGNGSTTIDAYSGETITTGIWYHLVMTAKVGENLKLYVNSVLKDTTAISSFGDSDEIFTFGRSAAGTDGKMDETGIWNRALSSTEVSKLYNNSKARHYE